MSEFDRSQFLAALDRLKSDLNAIAFAEQIQKAAEAAQAQGVGLVVDYDNRTAEPNAYVPQGTTYLISLEGSLPRRKGPEREVG